MISKSEISRLSRERLFYQPNSIRYKRLVQKSKRVNADTTDNLFKMAISIVKQADSKRLQAEYTLVSGMTLDAEDLEGGDIEERIPEARARELLAQWKQILTEYKQSGGNINSLNVQGSGSSQGLINDASSNEFESLKDKLFIASGEDQLDTWEAFKHYNLDTNLDETR